MKTPAITTLSVLTLVLLAWTGPFTCSAAAEQPERSFAVQFISLGASPGNLASDGANIWISKLAVVPVGNFPTGLAYDGANVWVTNRMSNSITVVRASDAVVLQTYGDFFDPISPAFDGQRMWVTNSSNQAVFLLRAKDGAHAGRVPVGDYPDHIIWYGTSMWTLLSQDASVAKITLQPSAAPTEH